jgi:putative transcriptional regulator
MYQSRLKKESFEELLESVRQGGAIMKGSREASRVFEFPESEVKKLRDNYGRSHNKRRARQ